MASRLSVLNLIATHLGQDRFMIDPGQNGALASTIAAVWEIARQDTLRANNWNFAGTRVSLAALTTPPAFGFSYAFEMPADFLRLTDVPGPYDNFEDFKFEGGKLLANVAPLNVIYVRDVVDPEAWDHKFVQVFAYHVASLCAMSVTGDMQLADDLMKRAMGTMNDAQQIDGQENPPQDFDTDPWLMARLPGAGWGSFCSGGH